MQFSFLPNQVACTGAALQSKERRLKISKAVNMSNKNKQANKPGESKEVCEEDMVIIYLSLSACWFIG